MDELRDAVVVAAAVAGNDDLLLEILVRLPVKPLARSKSVSKHWLSLISSPYFSLRRNPSPGSPSGLFLHQSSILFEGRSADRIANIRYLAVADDNGNHAGDDQITPLAFFHENPEFYVTNSCNGLLCCGDSKLLNYFVVNPTTKQFRNLNMRDLEFRHMKCYGVSLAFDPSKSPHYKVVCVRDPGFSTRTTHYYQIEIYSSETHTWRPSGDAFTAPRGVLFSRGVFWNGAVNWVSCTSEDSLYFNVDEERLQSMPMPPVTAGSPHSIRKVRYFGESRNHLHLVEFDHSQAVVKEFKIYEMERDYSGWFVRYSVAVDEVRHAYPEMIVDNNSLFSIFSILRRENDDDESLLVLQLHIAGKVICYSLMGKALEKVFDWESDDSTRFGWFNVYPYMECLSSV